MWCMFGRCGRVNCAKRSSAIQWASRHTVPQISAQPNIGRTQEGQVGWTTNPSAGRTTKTSGPDLLRLHTLFYCNRCSGVVCIVKLVFTRWKTTPTPQKRPVATDQCYTSTRSSQNGLFRDNWARDSRPWWKQSFGVNISLHSLK